MNPALDLSRLPVPAQKILAPNAPAPLRMGAARGLVPGLKPGDLVAVIAALTESDDAKVAETAKATLGNLPPPVLSGALAADLEPGAIDLMARLNPGRDEILEKLVTMARVSSETLGHLAATGSERITEMIATNEARILNEPALIERLYFNKNTRMSTTDRLIELASRNGIEVKAIPGFKEVAEALQNELIPEPDDEPSPDDLLFREVDSFAEEVDQAQAADGSSLFEDLEEEPPPSGVSAPVSGEPKLLVAAVKNTKKKEEASALHARIGEMTISQKIRMAAIGPGAARALLLRDTNKLVAGAAIRSPMVQEQDVERISKMRTVHEEVLRYIATKGDWLESHTVKFNLVSNPRTPLAYASKFVLHLRDDELKRLEKNRDVSAPVRTMIKQQIQRKTKKPGGSK